MISVIFFNNFHNLGCFWPKIKIAKNYCFEKVKKKKIDLLFNNFFRISYTPFEEYDFYDFVCLFCRLQCFRPFFLPF